MTEDGARAAEALRERESGVIVDTIPGLVAILTLVQFLPKEPWDGRDP